MIALNQRLMSHAQTARGRKIFVELYGN